LHRYVHRLARAVRRASAARKSQGEAIARSESGNSAVSGWEHGNEVRARDPRYFSWRTLGRTRGHFLSLALCQQSSGGGARSRGEHEYERRNA